MILTREQLRTRRHNRVRLKVSGTAERPRLCIRKSTKHIYAVLVDDSVIGGSKTLVAVTTNTKSLKTDKKHFANKAGARLLAAALAEKAKAKGIASVVFDRGGYRYHGVIKEFADAARTAGLKF